MFFRPEPTKTSSCSDCARAGNTVSSTASDKNIKRFHFILDYLTDMTV